MEEVKKGFLCIKILKKQNINIFEVVEENYNLFIQWY